MTGIEILNNPLVFVLVGIIISAFVAKSVIKMKKGKEKSATIQEIAQLKLDLERAELQARIATIKQGKPKGGLEKFLGSFIKGSDAGRKARKEIKL